MARAFRCTVCHTGYTTTGNDIPPGIHWNDGHVCELEEVESKLNKGRVLSDDEVQSLRDKAKNYAKKNGGYLTPCTAHASFSEEEEERERRMKVIAQNGNSGLHYDNQDEDAELPPHPNQYERKEEKSGD